MKIKVRVLYLSLMLVVLLSCNLFSGIISNSKSVQETSSPTVGIPSLTPPPTDQPNQPCPIPEGDPGSFEPATYEDMPENILYYLNSGLELEVLQSNLEEAGMAPPDTSGIVEKDFTGDGFYDLAIILLDPEIDFILPQGVLLLYQCQGDQYDLAYQSPDSMDWGAPTLYSSEDLNADGISDLLMGRQSCGAHTCFVQLEALLWNGDTMENHMEGTSEDMPSPNIEVFPDSNEFVVTAEGIGSFGAGPYRRFTRQWAWDAETGSFLPSADHFLPSNFRIHALQDADQAAEDGNYDAAIELYTSVIEDDELLDYADPPVERAHLGAYANFRLMVTYILMDDFESAEAAYTSIIANYPPGTDGADFALMAEVFWTEYASSSSLGSSCLAAQEFALSHQETILDTLYYGYANPTYEAEDICPFVD